MLSRSVDQTAFGVSLTFVLLVFLAVEPFTKAPAIIISSILLVAAIGIFAWFAVDMMIDVGNRTSMFILCFVLINFGSVIVLFGNIYRWTGLIYASSHEEKHALAGAIYFSIITWTTVGYGDITPGPNTRPIVACEALIGYVAMALLIAMFSAAFQTRVSSGKAR